MAMSHRSVPIAWRITSEIARSAGGSPVTIKKVLDELIASGKVDKLGPVKDWPNRGRGPIQYALSS